MEWQPLIQAPLLLWLSVAIVVCALVWLWRVDALRPPLETWAVIALLTAASLQVLRVVSLLGPATLVLLAPAIARQVGDRGRVSAATKAGLHSHQSTHGCRPRARRRATRSSLTAIVSMSKRQRHSSPAVGSSGVGDSWGRLTSLFSMTFHLLGR